MRISCLLSSVVDINEYLDGMLDVFFMNFTGTLVMVCLL